MLKAHLSIFARVGFFPLLLFFRLSLLPTKRKEHIGCRRVWCLMLAPCSSLSKSTSKVDTLGYNRSRAAQNRLLRHPSEYQSQYHKWCEECCIAYETNQLVLRAVCFAIAPSHENENENEYKNETEQGSLKDQENYLNRHQEIRKYIIIIRHSHWNHVK